MILFILLIYDKEFVGPLSTDVKLNAGQYRIECYGAQGGRGYENGRLNAHGGKGAYTTGVMQIKGSGTLFYLNVGGMGGYESCLGPNSGGYNGGGKGGKDIPDESGREDAPGGGNDASGGGGGATDIRINKNDLSNRIMVAAGGSGGAFYCNGAPGGDYTGYYPSSTECNVYVQSDLVTETKGNSNGVGSNGADGACTPGSGAGGGYRGGLARNHPSCKFDESHLVVAISGSSYISGHANFIPNKLMKFSQTSMHYGNDEKYGNSGNGRLHIKAIYECPSECSDCSSGSYCILCFSNAYKYNNLCYLRCDKLNNPNENKYFGADSANKICLECEIDWCMSCNDDYRECKKCIEGFHIENGICIHDPTFHFTNSNVFTLSSPFSPSSYFERSLIFSESELFSRSDLFSKSSLFSLSMDFSESCLFSKSKYFSKSGLFSKSYLFSLSLDFSESYLFSESKYFSRSDLFSQSSFFSLSSHFTESSSFSKSELFSMSNLFSKSLCFNSTFFFTTSDLFSESIFFSESDLFTVSNAFAESLLFTKSIFFSNSNVFSFSNHFSQSNSFSESEIFSCSSEFSRSKTFTRLPSFKNTIFGEVTFSRTFSVSLIKRRSVSFSFVYSYSKLKIFTYIMEIGEYVHSYTESFSAIYLPYIITFYSSTFVESYIPFPIHRKKCITSEQLIGIICVLTSIFFAILWILIMAFRKKEKTYDYDIFSSSDDNLVFENIEKEKNHEVAKELNSDDYDLNFWL